jgi:hypothetical protein
MSAPVPSFSHELPALVRRYVDRAAPAGLAVAQKVRITQVGEMWQKPGGRPLSFEAVEELAVHEVAFTWDARMKLAPLLFLRVVDRLVAGEGLLEARLLGLVPVMRQAGEELSEGEALRYLAELVWVPHAMTSNQRLEWRELDAEAVEVATQVGGSRAAARIDFDRDGDIAGASALARPRLVGKQTVLTPWAGSFGEYAVVGGIRIPTRGEVRWELADGPFTYWRARVTSLEAIP